MVVCWASDKNNKKQIIMTYEEMERLPVTDLAKVLAEIRMDKRFREYQHRCDEKWRAYARQRAIRRIVKKS